MNFSGRDVVFAISVIGNVLVFDANITSGPATASNSAYTFFFNSIISGTTSIIISAFFTASFKSTIGIILEKIESNIDGSVKYCTSLEWHKAMEVLKSSQVLVLPSRIESVPQSILEAFYLKIPVIATNVGGVHELVSNNKTGLLVTPNNSKELLEKINYLLNDIDLCNRLANNAHEFVMKNFSWEVLLPKYVKLYEN